MKTTFEEFLKNERFGPPNVDPSRYENPIEMESSGRFYFGGDGDGHWYMYPAELREKWSEMTINDLENDDEIEEFESIFGDYRLSGGIEQISFENPRQEK